MPGADNPSSRDSMQLEHHLKLALLVNLNVGALGLQGLLSPLTRELEDGLGIDLVRIGWIQAGFLLVYALATPFWAFASGRFSRRRLLICASLLWGTSVAVLTVSDNATVFTVCFWSAAIGNAAVIPLTFSLGVDLIPVRNRGYAFGWLATGQTLGMGLAFLTGGLLVESYGWRIPFLIFSGFAVLSAVSLILFLRKEPAHGAMEAELQSLFDSGRTYDYSIRFSDVKLLLSRRTNLMLALATLLCSVADGGIAFWFLAMLRDTHGFKAVDATWFTLALFAAQVPGGILLSTLSDFAQARWKRGKTGLLFVMTLVMAPCYFVALRIEWTTAAIGSAEFIAFLVLVVIGAFITGALPALLYNSVNDVNAPERRSLMFSLLSIARLGGRAIGVQLVSVIAAVWLAGNLSAGMAWAALAFIPAAVCVLPILSSIERDRESLREHLRAASETACI